MGNSSNRDAGVSPSIPARVHRTYGASATGSEDHINEYKNVPFPLSKINLGQEISKGQFGSVYFATALGIIDRDANTDVAIKKIGDHPFIDNMRLEKELEVMKTMEPHDNVLKLYGWCIEDRKVASQSCSNDDDDSEGNSSGQRSSVKENPYYLYIVMEFMKDGSLLEYLQENRDRKPPEGGYLLRYSYEICLGMQHLAKHKIVHRNLGARNVMIDSRNPRDLSCKISDFVLAVTLPEDTDTYVEKERIPLDVRWMAPECLSQGCFSIKTDVWAFGVVMWEIFSLGIKPYDDIESKFAIARDVQRGNLRLTRPRHCKEEKWHDKIMMPCWNKAPDKRPDFNKLEKLLSQALTVKKDYFQVAE